MFNGTWRPHLYRCKSAAEIDSACLLVALSVIISYTLLGAQRELSGAAETQLALDRLNVVGSVLMIAAHPDDENTALLAYFARGRKVRTGYLSLTRGEGGQNLIGPEQGDELGFIRTQELLAARRIDGAEQFFTRAIDFGFTKTPQETLGKMGPRQDPQRRGVGGPPISAGRDRAALHRHAARRAWPSSSVGDSRQGSIQRGRRSDALPGTVANGFKPWQAKRLMWNAGSVYARAREGAGKRDEQNRGGSGRLRSRARAIPTPRSRGCPAACIAARAWARRSARVHQKLSRYGGGRTRHAGHFRWDRHHLESLPGRRAAGRRASRSRAGFRRHHPAKIVSSLLAAKKLMAELHQPVVEIEASGAGRSHRALLGAVAGRDRRQVRRDSRRHAEADRDRAQPRAYSDRVESVDVDGIAKASAKDSSDALPFNEPKMFSLDIPISRTEPLSQPYWLREPKQGDTYTVPDQTLIGLPENPPLLRAHFHMRLESSPVEIVRPVIYRYVDRTQGELTRAIVVEPPVALQWSEAALLFPTAAAKGVELEVRSNIAQAAGAVVIQAPAGWNVAPESQDFRLSAMERNRRCSFRLTPTAQDSKGTLDATATVGDQTVEVGMETISYPHFPPQVLFRPARTELLRSDVRLLAKTIGYVMGAGDEVPAALRQMGAEVTLLSADDLSRGDLGRFDAIVTGVRAYNVRPDLRANQERLLEYVRNGGTLVVQYNAPEGSLDHIGPYPLTTGRDRVTMEDAPVELPNPASPLLHKPNDAQISKAGCRSAA